MSVIKYASQLLFFVKFALKELDNQFNSSKNIEILI
jgi:hypothetical protein